MIYINYIYNVETDDKDVKAYFADTPNEVDVIRTTVEDECCSHKTIDINLYGANFTFKLLELVRNIYHTFGYDSYVLREYIVEEVEKIYGEGYKAKDIIGRPKRM